MENKSGLRESEGKRKRRGRKGGKEREKRREGESKHRARAWNKKTRAHERQEGNFVFSALSFFFFLLRFPLTPGHYNTQNAGGGQRPTLIGSQILTTSSYVHVCGQKQGT